MEAKTHRNKIGARYLTEKEAALILPTYGQIRAQIDQFRREKQNVNQGDDSGIKGQKKLDLDQKTNNIGIIGVRGAGKTSILKTIRAGLEKENAEKGEKEKTSDKKQGDVILPIIVPENMSESSTLMAAVLGMLSDYIKENEPEGKRDSIRREPDCIRRGSCRECCDAAIKQYTYIQKEYRSILLHEYTSENDYVKSSADVFNSDTEFIYKFNELIEQLVNCGDKKDRLIFLFIDDIDLSTYRCADVVKTLLSYLSNRNIVTFISGDLETFEEALTLDFLRQDQVLDSAILDSEIGNKTILDSKKALAYEYLKKILPPVYRHNIKHWSLEEKGNYCVADSQEGVKEGKTFSCLLRDALKGWVNPAFFSFAEVKAGEGIKPGDVISYEERVLPYTFHLFDDTSRGLNNVYNVLLDIVAERSGESREEKGEREDRIDERQEERYLAKKKLLLDTIISSKPIYNQHRDEIQKNMFVIGAKREECRVFFENTLAIVYREVVDETEGDRKQTRKEIGVMPKALYQIKDPVERFSLFLLVDFAARLLYEDKYEELIQEENYRMLKGRAMKDLFCNPIIAGRVVDVPNNFSWPVEGEKPTETKIEVFTVSELNRSFLLRGDFVLNLAYYKNIPLDEMLELYIEKDKEASIELKQNIIIAVWKAFLSVAVQRTDEQKKEKRDIGDEKTDMNKLREVISRVYPVFWKEFAYIQNSLSGSAVQNIVIRIFSEEYEKSLPGGAEFPWEVLRKRQEKKRIILNTIAGLLEDGSGQNIKEELIDILSDVLAVWESENTKRRVEVLKAIDKGNLWRAEVAKTAVDFVKKSIEQWFRDIDKALPDNKETEGKWKVDTASAEENREYFDSGYDGVSETVFRSTKRKIRSILKEFGADFTQGIPFAVYDEIIAELNQLAGNNRVWYGQSEAQRVLNKLQEASAVAVAGEEPNQPYYVFLLQCFYKYKMAMGLDKDIIANGSLLARVREDLAAAHTDADKQALNDFITELNQVLEKESQKPIGIEEFDRLFQSENRKQKVQNDQ